MSLKIKVALLTLFTALAVGIGGAMWTTVRMHELLEADLQDRAVSIGTALAETLINQVVQRDKVAVIHGLKRLKKASADISYIYVTDFDGLLFGHSFEGGFPPTLDKAENSQALDQPLLREFEFAGHNLIEVTQPLIGSMRASVTIGMDAGFVHDQVLHTGLLILAASVGIGVLVSLFGIYFGGRLLAPITGLAAQMSRYGRGDTVALDDISRLSGSRETEALSHSFLDMIRERQHAEAQLNQIKDTLDNTHDGVFMFYPDSLRFFYVNRGAQQQVGYSQAELLSMTPVDIKPEIDDAQFQTILAPLLTGVRDSMTFETIHRHKSGTDVPVEIFLQYMSAAEPPHFLAMVRNISERKQAERALHEERNFSNAVLDNAGALIMVMDADGRIRRFNRACEQLSGYSFAEAEGRHPWDFLLLPEERAEVREQAFLALANNPQMLSGQYTNYWLGKDGNKRLIEWNNTVLLDAQGNMNYMVSIGTDITERRLAEEALQRLNDELEQRVADRTAALASSNKQLSTTLETLQHAQQELVRSEKLASLGSLVAGVAHELNTPLGNAVTIGTTLQEWLKDFEKEIAGGSLRRSTLNDFIGQANQGTNLLIRNLSRAAELISDFKQVAVDQTSAQRREFDLKQVVTEVVETLQPQFKKTPHQVVMDVAEGIHMDSYPGPLGQVVTNLALNALLHGFSDDMHGVVNINGRMLPEGKVELTVRDNGSGIPADHLAKVFDPFFTTKLGKGGSGLGLHIVYTLVSRVLGGSIDVNNHSDRGVELTILLPPVAPAGPAMANSE